MHRTRASERAASADRLGHADRRLPPGRPARRGWQAARLKRALLADSVAIAAGAGLGTSSTTAYIEISSGDLGRWSYRSDGRRGGWSVPVGTGFAPLAGTVPAFATAPYLCYVAVLMIRGLAEIDWDD